MDDIININENEYLPLRDVVFNTLKDAIITGKLEPNERLLENQLSLKLGVSRTPIREALRKLELEGFVEIIPRKGAIVSAMSEKDIVNVLEVRAALEALSAKLASRQITKAQLDDLKSIKDGFVLAMQGTEIEKMGEIDEKFHHLIFEASNNDKLIQIILNLRIQIFRYRIAYLKDKKSLKKIIKEHDDIYDALESHDEIMASELAFAHIKNQEATILNLIKENTKN